jgi:hypothetical protein
MKVINRMLIGSTTSQLLRAANCSVLVALPMTAEDSSAA